MSQPDEGALDFFRAMHEQFSEVLTAQRGNDTMLSALLTLLFTSYEGSVELQSEGLPEPDCTKGCATCCSVRVVATAPEVFLVARYLQATDAQLRSQGLDIRQRLADADEMTRNCSEEERVALRQRCPYIHKGACVIYPVRPLACRSHISYSQKACVDAAAGHVDEVPFSDVHMSVRSLVQNAMQSALRCASFPWATYELNHALSIALAHEDAERAWLASEDVLAPAQVADVSSEDMAVTYDQILSHSE